MTAIKQDIYAGQRALKIGISKGSLNYQLNDKKLIKFKNLKKGNVKQRTQ